VNTTPGKNLFARAVLQAYLAGHPIGDEQIKEEYERRKAALARCTQYKVCHILAANEARARLIAMALAEGAGFEQLVPRERLLDRAGAQVRGGSEGWISMDTAGIDRAILEAVRALRVGACTREPIRTRHGWHVLRVDAISGIHPLPFETVKYRLRELLHQQRLLRLMNKLQSGAKLTPS
jgi:peptidyl-prolyl cis-trans isomerase C